MTHITPKTIVDRGKAAGSWVLPPPSALPDDLSRARVARPASRKGWRVVRQMVLSQTEQGKGILRQRLLRRMFTLDALPGSLENNGHPLAPFSVNAEGARTCGLASIDNLIKRHPATSPKTVTLAISLLDRFLLKACRHLTQNPAPTQTDWKHARPFPIWARSGNTYNLDSPALRQAIPLACFVLACKHVET